ncbi:hypothetical protein JCM10212_000501 [Sporobolomyces blumeae]
MSVDLDSEYQILTTAISELHYHVQTLEREAQPPKRSGLSKAFHRRETAPADPAIADADDLLSTIHKYIPSKAVFKQYAERDDGDGRGPLYERLIAILDYLNKRPDLIKGRAVKAGMSKEGGVQVRSFYRFQRLALERFTDVEAGVQASLSKRVELGHRAAAMDGISSRQLQRRWA